MAARIVVEYSEEVCKAPMDSSSSSSISSGQPPKKRKYDSNEVNVMFRMRYNNMENQYMYDHQRSHAIQKADQSPSYPTTSSSGSDQRTPSPDFALVLAILRHPFPYSRPSRNIITPRAASDSGNSTMSDEINPLCMTDWYRDLLKPEYAQRLSTQLDIITNRSDFVKNKILTARIAELPESFNYYPNKSRLRKQYVDPDEAAERERNNLASRRSRFKKKRAQLILNMHLEYDRTENAHLYAMQSWIGKIIFQLETQWLERGATAEQMCQLRRDCGFPQTPPGAFRLI
ncbi:hypothetical protein quinque_010376 [Culex quinquefasciatus]